MRYLITGGAGFIGSHLAELLLGQGHRVVAIDDLSTGRIENIQHLRPLPHFQFVRENIDNAQVLDRLASEADVVVHLAAAVGVQLIVNDPVHTIRTNIMGTESVLAATHRYGCKVVIVGDIMHSRVARSNLHALSKLGAEVRVSGPPTMIPHGIEKLGATVHYRLDDALRDVDVVMMLRLQLERQGRGLFPTIREYSKLYGLNGDRLKQAAPGVLVMHPGPINRGVEIDSAVADGTQSVILPQVTFGIAVRMAVMSIIAGNEA